MILSILSKKFKVIESDPGFWSDNAMGRSNIGRGKILVNSTLSEDIKMETLLHEILHVIADDTGVEMDETKVSTISAVLFSAMRTNKNAFKRIMGI